MPSNNTKVQVTLGFNADTAAAKKAIDDLNSRLSKIQNMSVNNLGISQDLKEAADAASLLQQNLLKATNVDTGKLDIAQFARNLKAAGTDISQLSLSLSKAGSTGTQAFAQLSRAIADAEVPLKKTNTALTNMMTTLKNTIKWELSSNLVHGIESAFSNAISYAKNLNASLTDIRVVSGQTVDQMAKFAVEANNAAKALGTTTKSYADAALIYYQQGDSAELAAKKAEITLKATNAAFSATAEEMSELLTATWSSYQAGTDELEHMVDVMANLGAHTATSLEEIATALQKVAATANTVGVSMEQMSAMISTVSSVTRLAPTVVGTAMNTIMSRMGGLKLGETLEDGVDLNKYSAALKKVGVDVLDTTGNLREMGEVVEELGKKWQTLDKGQQSAIAQTIGGTRQYTTMMALFSNWDKYQENLGLAQNSNGALNKMQETYMESWEAASKKMKASLETIYSDLINDQGMIKLLNSLTKVIDQVENLIKTFGGLPGILTTIGGLALQVFSKDIGANIAKTIGSITQYANSFKNLGFYKDSKNQVIEDQNLSFGQKIGTFIHGSQMSTNQRTYQQFTNQTQNELQNISSGIINDPILSAQVQSTQLLLEKKQELQRVENSLTESQKLQAQQNIDLLTKQITSIDKMTQEYEELNQSINKQKTDFTSRSALTKSVFNITDTNKNILSGASTKDADLLKDLYDMETRRTIIAQGSTISTNSIINADGIEKFKDFIGYLERLNQLSSNIYTLGTTFSEVAKNIQDPEQALQRLNSEIDITIEDIKRVGGDTSSIDKLKEKLNSLDTSDVTGFKNGIASIADELDKLGHHIDLDIDQSISILSARFGMSKEQLKQFCTECGLTEEQIRKIAQAFQKAEGAAGGFDIKTSQMQKNIQGIVQAVGAAINSFSMMSNLMANWDTSNLTSKVTSIGMQVTNLAGSLMSGNWMAALGQVAGIAAGVAFAHIEKLNKKFSEFVTAHEKQVKEFSAISESELEELETNNDLITSYNDLYEAKLRGEDVAEDLLAAGAKLIEAYHLEGQAVNLLQGNYKALTDAAKEAAVARAQTLIAEGKTNLANAQSLLATATFEGDVRPTAQGVAKDRTAYNQARRLQSEGYGGEITAEKRTRGSTVYSTTGVNIYDQSEASDIALSALKGSGLDQYIYNGRLFISDSDTADYRTYIYEALEKTIKDIQSKYGDNYQGLQTDEVYKALFKYYNGWKDEFDALENGRKQIEQAIQTGAESYLIGTNSKTSWTDYKKIKKDVLDFFTIYFEDLNITEDELEDKVNSVFSGTALVYHNLAETVIKEFLDESGLTDEQKVDFDKIINQYISQYGIESIGNKSILQTLLTGYQSEGLSYKITEDKELSSRTKAQSNIMNGSLLEQTKAAQKALKEGMSTNEFNNAMANVLEWGKNNIITYETFVSYTYEQQVAYLDNLKQKILTDTSDISASLIALQDANQAQIDFNNKYTKEEQLEFETFGIRQQQLQDNYLKASSYKFNGEKFVLSDDIEADDYVREYIKGQNITTEEKLNNFLNDQNLMSNLYLYQYKEGNYNNLAKDYEQFIQDRSQLQNPKDLEQQLETDIQTYIKGTQESLISDISALSTILQNGEISSYADLNVLGRLFSSEQVDALKNVGSKTDFSNLLYDYIKQFNFEEQTITYSEIENILHGLGQEVSAENIAQFLTTNSDWYKAIFNNEEQQEMLQALLEKAMAETKQSIVEKNTKSIIQEAELASNAISALQSDLQNLASGKGLSKKTQNILVLAGIDPKSITDIKTAREEIQNLQDRANKAQKDFEAEYEKQYGESFVGVSEKTLKEWQNADEGSEKAVLYAAYQKQLSLGEAYAAGVDAIMQSYTIEIDNAVKRLNADIEKLAKNSEKLKSAANIFANALQTGKLTNEQMATIGQTEKGQQLLEQWKNTTNYTGRANITSQMYGEYLAAERRKYETQMQGYDVKQISAEKFGAYANINRVFDEKDFNTFIQRMSDQGINELLIQNIRNAREELGSSSTWGEIRTRVEEVGGDFEQQFKQVEAIVIDSMKNCWDEVAEQEKNAAQKAIDDWKNAFDIIANLRMKILSNESIMGDFTDLNTLLTLMKQTGLSAGELYSRSKNGTLGKVLETPKANLEDFQKQTGLDFVLEAMGLKNGQNAITNLREVAEKRLGKDYGIAENRKDIDDYVRAELDKYFSTTITDENERKAKIDEIFASEDNFSTAFIDEVNKLNEALEINIKATNEEVAFQEAQQRLETTKEEQNKIISQETSYKDASTAIREGETIEKALSGLNAEEYIKQVRQILGDETLTLSDMENWDEKDTRWDKLAQGFDEQIIGAHGEIYQAAVEFRQIVTGKGEGELGFQEGSSQYQTAQEAVTDAVIGGTSAIYDGVSDMQDVSQSMIDTAEERQSAISGALDAKTADQRVKAAEALREAYVGANEELRKNAELMAKNVEEGKDLTKENRILTSDNVKLGRSYANMTKQQRNQYKQMLKNNKVTVDGYETLEDYFKVLDQGADYYDEVRKAADKLIQDGSIEGITDIVEDTVKETEDVLDASDNDMIELMQNLLPDAYDGAADELWSVMKDFGGDYDKFLHENFDKASQSFTEGGQQLLQAMGLTGDQIEALQTQIQEKLKANAALGDINFLSMIADMNVDPTLFDSIITALNNAMTQIQNQLRAKGITLNPAWTNVPTLSSLGIGKGKGGGGSSGGGGKGGGGGGGKDKAKKVESYVQASQEKERYHEIRDQLEKQGNLLDKIDKLKDRTFGAKHLKQINDEIKALEKDTKLQEQYYREAAKYYESNMEKLKQAGALFNEDGTVQYEEFMDRIIAEYNEAVDAFNWSEQGALDELRLEKAKARFEELKKLLEDYEEDLDLLDEIQAAIIEDQNKISAAALEGIQYKVEIKLDLSDRDIAILEYFNDKWEELLERQDDRMLNMTKQVQIYETNLNALGVAMRELQAKYNEGVLTEADYAEGMKDINDKILEQLESIQDVKDSLKELYGDTLELASDKIEKYTSIIDHSREVMEDYIAMSELMGRGADYAGLEEVYQMQYDSSVTNVEAAKMYLDTLKASRDEIERQVAENGWTEVLQQQWYDVTEAITDGENELLDKTQQALEDAQSMFENTMQKIIASFDDVLFNMKNGLSQLEDDYNYYSEQQERYLSTSKELYEVAKLNRQIDESIQDATTKTSKERLKALQEVINKQSESTRLTEYDVEMLELQYKHALALQALEEAQNAKSTVRLTRDENGNYGYQYTADDDQINDARQQVDDALQEINELAANRAAEIEQQVIETERQYRDELLAIAQDTTLTLEERQAKMEELTRRHNETLQFYNEQYTNATSALLTNQEYVYERYSVSIMENTGIIQDQMNATVKAMIDKTSDYASYLEEQMSPGGQIYEALAKYKQDMGIVEGASGLTWSDMTGSIDQYRDANEKAKESIADVNTILQQTLAGVADVTEQWDKHLAALEKVIAMYEKLGQSAADAVRKVSDVEGLFGIAVGGSSGINAQAGVTGLSTKTQWQYTWGPSHGLFGVHSAYDSEAAALEGAKADIKAQFQNLIKEGEDDAETDEVRRQAEAWMADAMKTISVVSYLTGGLADYTGPAWLDGSKSAPELVLNSRDTANLLSAVDIVRAIDEETLRQISSMMKYSAISAVMSVGNGLSAGGVNPFAQTLDQNVHIEADFPNVTDKNEIIEAFDDLVNLASQYAGRG